MQRKQFHRRLNCVRTGNRDTKTAKRESNLSWALQKEETIRLKCSADWHPGVYIFVSKG